MPIVYNYSPTTGIYSHKTEARESPLEPGVFLLPAHATFTEVPDVPKGQVAVFDPRGQKWVPHTAPAIEPPEPLSPPDDLAPGLPPVFPENPKDGDVAWSAREDGTVIQWNYQSSNSTWAETVTDIKIKPYLGLEKYATHDYVHEYVEARLADALKAVASKVEEYKQADSA